MATRSNKVVQPDNMAELLHQLGGVPLERILVRPAPGTATEADVLAAERQPRKRLCELVDGVLVEKPMSALESLLAIVVARLVGNFADEEDRGVVLGADAMLRLFPGQVRIPDVSFISWDNIPGGKMPSDPIASLVPDLAVEVLSPSNTRAEMNRKLRDYFLAGTRLVWIIDPKTRTAEMYTSPTDVRRVRKNGNLDGGDVLPGFRLSLPDLFARLERRSRKQA